jgi:hypothetical protein
VPEIDHRVGKGLEGIVQSTDALEAQQKPAELVFPGKHPFDCPEALCENGWIEDHLASPLRLLSTARIGVDVGNHATIEDRLAVGPAVVDAIETDDAASKVNADLPGDAGHVEHRLAQQRRFVAVARRRYEWGDYIAVTVAEGDDLVALDLLVAAEAEVVAPFFAAAVVPSP